MPKTETPPNEEKDDIGPIEAYDILLQRQINEDRILVERTNIFLLATAFLFVAFVALLDPDWEGCIFTVLRFLLPILGIVLTTMLYLFNKNAIKALAFWHDAQCKIERESPEFAYMREHNIAPHLQRFELGDEPKDKKKRPSGTRPIYKYYLPLAFLLLWLASLTLVIVS